MAKNIFEGDNNQVPYVIEAYNLLKTREWITYADIMASARKLNSAQDLRFPISKYKDYGDLKKAFCNVRNTIKKITKDEHCIESEGSNQNKRFRYVGKDDDPLASLKNAVTIRDLKTYWEFCQDSAGFLPTCWLEHFFKNSQDLFNIQLKRRTGEQIIYSSVDRKLTNIEMLPLLYEAIKQRQVLTFGYNPFGEGVISIILHPHILKAFNGRWYMFGHADHLKPYFGFNVAIDRIVTDPQPISDLPYVNAPDHFYERLFQNMIGVTHLEGNEATKIRVRANNIYMFRLTETKPIHASQITVKTFGEYEDGLYGEFELFVEVNNEFIGRILQMGAGLEVTAPIEVRKLLTERVKELYEVYAKEL